MEPIPSFSSPVKPAMQSTDTSNEITQSADETMDIVESKLAVWEEVYQCSG